MNFVQAIFKTASKPNIVTPEQFAITLKQFEIRVTDDEFTQLMDKYRNPDSGEVQVRGAEVGGRAERRRGAH